MGRVSVLTVKKLLRAKKILDKASVPQCDRVYWDGERFTFYKGKGV